MNIYVSIIAKLNHSQGQVWNLLLLEVQLKLPEQGKRKIQRSIRKYLMRTGYFEISKAPPL